METPQSRQGAANPLAEPFQGEHQGRRAFYIGITEEFGVFIFTRRAVMNILREPELPSHRCSRPAIKLLRLASVCGSVQRLVMEIKFRRQLGNPTAASRCRSGDLLGATGCLCRCWQCKTQRAVGNHRALSQVSSGLRVDFE